MQVTRSDGRIVTVIPYYVECRSHNGPESDSRNSLTFATFEPAKDYATRLLATWDDADESEWVTVTIVHPCGNRVIVTR